MVNALSNDFDPYQVLADLLRLKERKGDLTGVTGGDPIVHGRGETRSAVVVTVAESRNPDTGVRVGSVPELARG